MRIHSADDDEYVLLAANMFWRLQWSFRNIYGLAVLVSSRQALLHPPNVIEWVEARPDAFAFEVVQDPQSQFHVSPRRNLWHLAPEPQ